MLWRESGIHINYLQTTMSISFIIRITLSSSRCHGTMWLKISNANYVPTNKTLISMIYVRLLEGAHLFHMPIFIIMPLRQELLVSALIIHPCNLESILLRSLVIRYLWRWLDNSELYTPKVIDKDSQSRRSVDPLHHETISCEYLDPR